MRVPVIPAKRITVSSAIGFFAVAGLLLLPLQMLTASGSAERSASGKFVFSDDTGAKVEFVELPKRFVSLAPSVTETFYALGAGNLLVGRSDADNFPAEALKLPAVASYGTVNLEAIHGIKAELAVDANLFGPDALAALKQSGVPALNFNPNNTIQGTFSFIEKIGKLTGKEAAAKQLNQNIQNKLSDIERKIGTAVRPKVYYCVGFGEGGDWTAGKDTFINEVIVKAGGRNAAEALSGWQISREAIAQIDPDYIILPATWAKVSDFVNAPFYKDLRASKTGKVFLINNDLTERPGPRIADGVEALAKIIQAQAFK